MAKQSSKTSSTRVTRIKASDSNGKKAEKPKQKPANKRSSAKPKPADVSSDPITAKTKNPFAALWRYFKGAWYELRQVRWPDRPTTWKMTGALLLFTLFFVALIALLDTGFKYLFELILG